jgi:hypothetical protein
MIFFGPGRGVGKHYAGYVFLGPGFAGPGGRSSGGPGRGGVACRLIILFYKQVKFSTFALLNPKYSILPHGIEKSCPE